MKLILQLTFVLALITGCSAQNDSTQVDSTAHDIKSLDKVSSPMYLDQYWSIVSNSIYASTDQSSQAANLTQELKKLPLEEIIGFQFRTDLLVRGLYSSEHWCAGYIINGGYSDDGFEYFRRCIVSLGKDVYNGTLSNPDYLATVRLNTNDYFEFEAYNSVAMDAFKQKTGKDMSDYMDYKSFNKTIEATPEIVFNWDGEDAASMEAICPELFGKYWD